MFGTLQQQLLLLNKLDTSIVAHLRRAGELVAALT